jgi:hypothetical protein
MLFGRAGGDRIDGVRIRVVALLAEEVVTL